MKTPLEIRSDFIDDQNLLHIDCWFTEDDNEEGKTILVIDLDTKKEIWFDNRYRLEESILEEIRKVKQLHWRGD